MNQFCPNCGQKISEGDSQFCMNCGYNLNQGSQVNNNTNIPQPGVNVYQNSVPTQQVNNYSNGMGIAGFVISLVSLILCCGSLSWLSIIFSIIGMKNAKQHNGAGNGLSIAGLVISIVGLVIFLFYFSAFFAGVMEGISA